MLDRRAFLRRASLVAAGLVAGDQLELVDRLGWTRTLFPSVLIRETLWGDGRHDDTPGLTALIAGKEVFDHQRNAIIPAPTPTAPSYVYLRHGYYRLNDTVVINGRTLLPRYTHFDTCVFEGWEGKTLFHFGAGLPPVRIADSWMETNEGAWSAVSLSTWKG